jgi:hypothetical protein
MDVHRPPLAFCVLLGASLALSAITAGYAARYTRDWSALMRRPVEEQRRAFGGVPYFRESFVELVSKLKEAIPPGAGVLVEPIAQRGTPTGPRWHVFLAHYAYPLELYVRRPVLSCVGFNYRAWIDHHLDHPELDAAERAALDERGVEWRLRMPVGWPLDESQPVLERRVDGAWVAVPL